MPEHEWATRHATGKTNLWVALAFVVVLLALSALAINLFHVGLPTCLTDIKPFQKGELITHSPTHYELHSITTRPASQTTFCAGAAKIASSKSDQVED